MLFVYHKSQFKFKRAVQSKKSQSPKIPKKSLSNLKDSSITVSVTTVQIAMEIQL